MVHRTSWRHTLPAVSAVQTLRLTPRREPHLRPLLCRTHAPGALSEWVDPFGYVSHTPASHEPHVELALDVRGMRLGGVEEVRPVHVNIGHWHCRARRPGHLPGVR
jgi:hypothetical protein